MHCQLPRTQLGWQRFSMKIWRSLVRPQVLACRGSWLGREGNQGFTYHSLPKRHYSPHWGLNPGPSVYRTDALPLSYRGCCGRSNCQSSWQLTALQLNQWPAWDSPYLINQRTLILEASAEPAISSLEERRLIFAGKRTLVKSACLSKGRGPGACYERMMDPPARPRGSGQCPRRSCKI